MTSKTKTFQQDDDFGDLMQWVVDNIPTEDHESIYSGASPSMDIITRLKTKIRITISQTGGDTSENKK